MLTAYKRAGASTVGAVVDHATAGGFTAVASNGDLDRDGERILPGCFAPLPATVPMHLDHAMTAAGVVARGRPFYRGDELLIDAVFSSTADAQQVRAKIADGTLDSLSIVFRGLKWQDIEGVRTCVKGELLAVDIVSVPSNAGALVLSSRSFGASPSDALRSTVADALLILARAEIAEAKKVTGHDRRGLRRRQVDDLLHEALRPNEPPSITSQFRRR